MTTSFVAGNVVQFTATFTDLAGGNIDPTTVAFTYVAVGSGVAPATLTYSGSTTPSVGVVARTSTGVYVAQVDTTNLAGNWSYQWRSTGVGQAVAFSSIVVSEPPFPI